MSNELVSDWVALCASICPPEDPPVSEDPGVFDDPALLKKMPRKITTLNPFKPKE